MRANLRALAICLVLVNLMLYSVGAFAIGYVNRVPGPPVTLWQSADGVYRDYGSIGAVCSAWMGAINASDAAYYGSINYSFQAGGVSVAGGICQRPYQVCSAGGCSNGLGTGTPTSYQAPAAVCPQGSTLTGGSNCLCNAGSRSVGGGYGASVGTSCAAYTCPAKPKQDRSAGPFDTQAEARRGEGVTHDFCDTYPTSAAQQGTEVDTYGCRINEIQYGAKQGPDGKWLSLFVSAYNATTCEAGNTADPNNTVQPPSGAASAPAVAVQELPTASACAKDTCPGTFNGQAMCLACSRVVSTETTGSQSGSASAPSATSQGTTTSTRDCNAEVCTVTTTTTVTTSAGTATSSTTRTEPNNGNAASGAASGAGGAASGASSPGSSFGGTCAATSCTGDAVVCAIAKEQAKRACQMALLVGDGTANALTDLATGAATAGDLPAAHPRNAANVTTKSLAGGLDQTDILSGSCPADLSVPVGARSVSLPFSKMCGPAAMLGNVLVGLTALSCLLIMFPRS